MTVKIYKKSSGFTLLETMVAIAILLIAVVGPISIIGGSLHNIYFARDQVIAVNLAQEGIEVIRQVRDTNMLKNNNWDKGFELSQCGAGNKECIVDASMDSLVISPCGGSSCSPTDSLVYQDSNGLYRQTLSPAGMTATNFSRKVTAQAIVNNVEYKITSTVTWSTGNTLGSVAASESIFKWAKP